MKQFNYTPKTGIMECITSFIMPVVLIVLPIVYPFGIRLKRFNLLPYPYSMYVLVAIGALLFIYQLRRIRKDAKLKQHVQPIRVDEDKISFVRIHKGIPQEVTFTLADIKNLDLDTEDEILEVQTEKSKYKFDADFFDSKAEFKQFMKVLQQ